MAPARFFTNALMLGLIYGTYVHIFAVIDTHTHTFKHRHTEGVWQEKETTEEAKLKKIGIDRGDDSLFFPFLQGWQRRLRVRWLTKVAFGLILMKYVSK